MQGKSLFDPRPNLDDPTIEALQVFSFEIKQVLAAVDTGSDARRMSVQQLYLQLQADLIKTLEDSRYRRIPVLRSVHGEIASLTEACFLEPQASAVKGLLFRCVRKLHEKLTGPQKAHPDR